jgi:hypothetical protein
MGVSLLIFFVLLNFTLRARFGGAGPYRVCIGFVAIVVRARLAAWMKA